MICPLAIPSDSANANGFEVANARGLRCQGCLRRTRRLSHRWIQHQWFLRLRRRQFEASGCALPPTGLAFLPATSTSPAIARAAVSLRGPSTQAKTSCGPATSWRLTGSLPVPFDGHGHVDRVRRGSPGSLRWWASSAARADLSPARRWHPDAGARTLANLPRLGKYLSVVIYGPVQVKAAGAIEGRSTEVAMDEAGAVRAVRRAHRRRRHPGRRWLKPWNGSVHRPGWHGPGARQPTVTLHPSALPAGV